MLKSIKSIKKIVFLAIFGYSLATYGAGFQLYSESSAETLALGGAVVAFEGNISNAWYNPASLYNEKRPAIMAGGTFLKLSSTYDYGTGRDHLKDAWHPTGFLYSVFPLPEDFFLTYSVNAPYGMISEWSNNSKEAQIATYTNIRAIYNTINLGYKICDEFAVAGGFNVVTSFARMARNLPSVAGEKNKIYMKADDPAALGYTFSCFYKPFEDWTFGANYQSRVKLRLRGECHYRNGVDLGQGPIFQGDDVSTDLTLPSSVALGVSNTSIPKLRLGFSAIFTEWSVYDVQKIKFDKMPGNTSVSGTSRHEKEWSDNWSLRFGGEYNLTENWILRAGFCQDFTQDNDKYRSPEVPDSDRQMYTVGIGYQAENWTYDLSYGYVNFASCRIGDRTGSVANGKYKNTDCHCISFAVTRYF